MALTFISVPAGTSVQLDDGSHASVYIQNVGQRHVVIEPGGTLLRASQIGTFPCVSGAALTASAGINGDAVLAYQVGGAATPPAPAGGLLIDGGSA